LTAVSLNAADKFLTFILYSQHLDYIN